MQRETLAPLGRKLGDDPVTLFPTEQPRYPALSRAIGSAWSAARDAWIALRDDWFDILNLVDPAKRDSDPLTRAQAAALDAATARFLRQMAGEDRTAAGFAAQNAEDGIIQQSVYLANRVGTARAIDESGHTPRNPALSSAQRQRLASESFQRLSADGKLRFETRLGDIRARMDEAFRRGENPLKVAKELSSSLGLEASRTRTLIRTEMGMAAMSGQTDLYREAGISLVEVIGDPNTDELCTVHIGREYAISDSENLPIYHPNCFCDVVPIMQS